MKSSLSASLFDYFPFYELSGDAASIIASGARTLTQVNDPGSVPGKFHLGRSFVAASSESFSIADAPAISLGTRTFLGWFYPTTNADYFMEKYDGAGSDVEYRLLGNGAGDVYVGWHDAGGVFRTRTAGGTLVLNAWNFIGFGWDAINAEMMCRLNESETISSYLGQEPVDRAQNLLIGRSSADPYTSNICELMIWGRVLSRNERDFLWNRGRGNCLMNILFGNGYCEFSTGRGHGVNLGVRRNRVTGMVV